MGCSAHYQIALNDLRCFVQEHIVTVGYNYSRCSILGLYCTQSDEEPDPIEMRFDYPSLSPLSLTQLAVQTSKSSVVGLDRIGGFPGHTHK